MTTSSVGHDHTRVRANVSDTGIGLSPLVIDRLFGQFRQADSSASCKFGGTCLGLAISKRFIELMGGQIGAKNDGRMGSSFWFALDVENAIHDARAVMVSPPERQFRHLKVLLAEDNVYNQLLVKALLAPFDIDLHIVENGSEAVSSCRHLAFDLILMDMQMPIIDHLVAAHAIRAAEGPERDVPIVASTANVTPDPVEACRSAGMQGHLAKPIDPQALVQALCDYARTLEAPPLSDAA